ncbi:MAG: hypothetical protein JJT76_12755 [Clostridiaceae bacterium]|nr:hypothetical protein [Clostridiaceae bacterium]
MGEYTKNRVGRGVECLMMFSFGEFIVLMIVIGIALYIIIRKAETGWNTGVNLRGY